MDLEVALSPNTRPDAEGIKTYERILSVPHDPSTSMHEYIHHIQHTHPTLQDPFTRLHIRRTTYQDGSRHPMVFRQYGNVKYWTQEDDWPDNYQGRIYRTATQQPDLPANMIVQPGSLDPILALQTDQPIELPTVGYQTLLGPGAQHEELRVLIKDDPDLLNLLIGVLLRYDP